MDSASNRLHILGHHIASQENLVIYKSTGKLLTITLNRPKALNSLNLTMVDDLMHKLPLMNQHQAVWMQGSGGKSFCAGGDVKVLFQEESKIEDRLKFFRNEFTLDYKISQLQAVQISCWDGIVMGGGVGLSVFAPIIIATEKTLFAMPETKLGFYTDVGANFILSKLRNNIGYYLGMTGASLKGQQVYIAGIANFFIPSAKIKQAYQQISRTFQQKIQNPKQSIKVILQKYHSPSGKKMIQNQEKIKVLFDLNSGQEIYKKSSTSSDQFYQKVAKMMREVCPISIQLVRQLINRTNNFSLKQCFIRDFEVIQHMVINDDFKEGIRSVLVEKGSKAKWSCPDIQMVSQSKIQTFLKPIQWSVPLKLE